MSELFRPAAVAARFDRLNGAVVLRQPVRFRLLAAASGVLMLSALALLAHGEFSRRQAVAGQIVPSGGIIRVHARQAGIVDRLLIAEGEHVQSGAQLASISSRRERSDGADTDARQAEQAEAAITELQGKLDSEETLTRLEVQRLAAQAAALHTDIDRLRQKLATEDERVTMLESRRADFSRLRMNGHVSRLQESQQYQNLLDARLHRDDTARTLATQQAALEETELQRLQEPPRAASRSADLRNQIVDMRQRLLELESRREHALTAPSAGRIAVLQAKAGQYVTPEQPLLTLIPDGSRFEAELYVPTRAIGFVRAGQPVNLRYTAFPYQRYGIYRGRVKEISRAILATNPNAPTPMPFIEPMYRVTATLNEQDVSAYGQRYPLQAGMLLEADIVFDRRPVWQWLLEPLLSVRGRLD